MINSVLILIYLILGVIYFKLIHKFERSKNLELLAITGLNQGITKSLSVLFLCKE